MPIIRKIKVFFTDYRGEIKDIFTKEKYDHCSTVSFKKNAIRGNHFHKKSIQSSYILKGVFKVTSAKINKKTLKLNKIITKKINEGTFICHKEYEAHSYRCLSKNGLIIVFTKGVRGGINYEKDTFRLKNKIFN
jgi:dTDP-4-dehydrorhamnose 3,5-epimerase-like enzyme